MDATFTRQRFNSLQYLRAFSAFAVILVHAGMHFKDNIPFGEGRVALFFTMSGFVLWWITAGREYRAFDAIEFLARRAGRIIPSYWLVTFIIAAACWIGLWRSDAVPVSDFVKSMLFIPYGSGVHGNFFPVLRPGWTLVFELFFCFSMSTVLIITPKFRIWCLTALLGSLGVVGLMFHPTGAAEATLTGFPMIQILAGLWIANLWSRLTLPKPVCGLLLVIGLIVSFAWPIFARDGAATVPSAPRTLVSALLILIGGLGLERPGDSSVGWLKFVGDASYSIYLWHWPLMNLVVKLIAISHANMPREVWIAITSLLSMGVGCVMYQVVERPITLTMMRLIDRWKPSLPTRSGSNAAKPALAPGG